MANFADIRSYRVCLVVVVVVVAVAVVIIVVGLLDVCIISIRAGKKLKIIGAVLCQLTLR